MNAAIAAATTTPTIHRNNKNEKFNVQFVFDSIGAAAAYTVAVRCENRYYSFE